MTSTTARTSSENVTSRFCNHFSIIQRHYACEMCLTILELNWDLRFRNKKTEMNICYHMLTSSTQLQNRSFHDVERARTSVKCLKVKNVRAKRAKLLFYIVKYANLWRSCCRRRRGSLSSLMAVEKRRFDIKNGRSVQQNNMCMLCVRISIRTKACISFVSSES